MLYRPLADPPELSVQPPFAAPPLLVSGTDSSCPGEYLYQGYLFDDHGANTSASLANGEEFGTFPPAGDLAYPPDDRYAGNAADLVEFRLHAGATETVIRITFNTVVAVDAPVVGIGIDADQVDEVPVAWPGGAGASSPGLDTFITAWGTGGALAHRSGTTFDAGAPLPAGSVSLDATTNQLTIRVPTSSLPRTPTWRLVAGAGLWDGDHGFLAVDDGAPAVFDLAFRFDEGQQNPGGFHDTFIGYGNWFDEAQAAALADGTTGTAFTDVTFADLDTDHCRPIHGPTSEQARIMGSHLDIPEGVHGTQPTFGGRLQPYMLHLPPPAADPPGLTLALHGNSATYTQWHATSPNYLVQLGDDRNQAVLSPLGRSTSGSGITHDWFEAWADAAHHVELDPDRTTISGYSAGGYSTFVAGTMFPDLFGGAFAIVGAGRLLDGGVSGDHTNFDPNLGNLRWVPVVAWNQAVDELAPYIGIRGTTRRLNELGLRNNLFTFLVGEHFTPGLLDQWTGAADYLGDAVVTRDPYRVDLTIAPETWAMLAPAYGPDTDHPEAHVVADHAYWVSDLRTRDEVRDATGTIRGSITAVSQAFGRTDPTTTPVVDVYPGPPQPATVDGTAWGELGTSDPENRLDIDLTNIGTATVTGTRAGLRADRRLTIAVSSDGDARVRLDLPLPAGTTVVDGDGNPRAGAVLDDTGVDLTIATGTSTFVLVSGDAADAEARTAARVDAGRGLPATGGRAPTGLVLALVSGAAVLAGTRRWLISGR